MYLEISKCLLNEEKIDKKKRSCLFRRNVYDSADCIFICITNIPDGYYTSKDIP